MRIVYVLNVFDKDDERLVSSHPIPDSSLPALLRMFGEDSSQPLADSYRVGKTQKAALDAAAGVRFDLKRFYYFLTAEPD